MVNFSIGSCNRFVFNFRRTLNFSYNRRQKSQHLTDLVMAKCSIFAAPKNLGKRRGILAKIQSTFYRPCNESVFDFRRNQNLGKMKGYTSQNTVNILQTM